MLKVRILLLVFVCLITGCASISEPPNNGVRSELGVELSIVKYVQPEYPKLALLNELNGWVKVKFDVEADGYLSNILIVDSSHQIFHEASLNAVRQWQFEPFKVDGISVKYSGYSSVIEFTLED